LIVKEKGKRKEMENKNYLKADKILLELIPIEETKEKLREEELNLMMSAEFEKAEASYKERKELIKKQEKLSQDLFKILERDKTLLDNYKSYLKTFGNIKRGGIRYFN
jgi:hypothetical protein